MTKIFEKKRREKKSLPKTIGKSFVSEFLYIKDSIDNIEKNGIPFILKIDSNLADSVKNEYQSLKKSLDTIYDDLKEFEQQANEGKVTKQEAKNIREKIDDISAKKQQIELEINFLTKNRDIFIAKDGGKIKNSFEEKTDKFFENINIETSNLSSHFENQQKELDGYVKTQPETDASEIRRAFYTKQVNKLSQLAKSLLERFSNKSSEGNDSKLGKQRAINLISVLENFESQIRSDVAGEYTRKILGHYSVAIEALRNFSKSIKKNEETFDVEKKYKAPKQKFGELGIERAYDSNDLLKSRSAKQNLLLEKIMKNLNGNEKINNLSSLVKELIESTNPPIVSKDLLEKLEKHSAKEKLSKEDSVMLSESRKRIIDQISKTVDKMTLLDQKWENEKNKKKGLLGRISRIWDHTGRRIGLAFSKRKQKRIANKLTKEINNIDQKLLVFLNDELTQLNEVYDTERKNLSKFKELQELLSKRITGSPKIEDQEGINNQLEKLMISIGADLDIDAGKTAFESIEQTREASIDKTENSDTSTPPSIESSNINEFINSNIMRSQDTKYRKTLIEAMDDGIKPKISNDEKAFWMITAFNAAHNTPLLGRIDKKDLKKDGFKELEKALSDLEKNIFDYVEDEYKVEITESDDTKETSDESKQESKDKTEETEPAKKEKKANTKEKKNLLAVNSFTSSLNVDTPKGKEMIEFLRKKAIDSSEISEKDKKRIRNTIVNLVRINSGLKRFKRQSLKEHPQLPENYKGFPIFNSMKRLGNMFGIDDSEWESSFKSLDRKSEYAKRLIEDLGSIWKYENKKRDEKIDYMTNIASMLDNFTNTGNNEELVKYLFDRYRSITSEELNAKIGDGKNKKLKSEFRKILDNIGYTLKDDFDAPEDTTSSDKTNSTEKEPEITEDQISLVKKIIDDYIYLLDFQSITKKNEKFKSDLDKVYSKLHDVLNELESPNRIDALKKIIDDRDLLLEIQKSFNDQSKETTKNLVEAGKITPEKSSLIKEVNNSIRKISSSENIYDFTKNLIEAEEKTNLLKS